uniref:Uncharacterized protein n=1 Tax=Anguilla anguilla TaxID=7936 RepID=A0A0E9W3H7_ANGAN
MKKKKTKIKKNVVFQEGRCSYFVCRITSEDASVSTFKGSI